MSILIKGMKMPEKQVCIILNPNGLVEVLDANNVLLEEYQAVPVPPHERLIDADALYKEALERSETKDGYYNCLEPVISCYTIDHAPTIIPASKEGET